eukprot:m.110175 g.110175  ORF g.110175 m.110175 type:complete len:103 (+) comp10707_c3_seq4:3-311(+)
MYVCMYVRMCARVYVCTCVCVCTHVCVCGYTGNTVYFGEIGPSSQHLVNFFESNGAPTFDKLANPAEVMLDVRCPLSRALYNLPSSVLSLRHMCLAYITTSR